MDALHSPQNRSEKYWREAPHFVQDWFNARTSIDADGGLGNTMIPFVGGTCWKFGTLKSEMEIFFCWSTIWAGVNLAFFEWGSSEGWTVNWRLNNSLVLGTLMDGLLTGCSAGGFAGVKITLRFGAGSEVEVDGNGSRGANCRVGFMVGETGCGEVACSWDSSSSSVSSSSSFSDGVNSAI